MSETEKASSKNSDLPARFAAGVVMIAVALAATYVGGWPFRSLIFVAAAVMMIEWSDMHRVPRLWAWTGIVLLAATLLGVAEYLYPVSEWLEEIPEEATSEAFAANWAGFAIIAGMALLLGILSRRAVMAWGFVYLALPSFALLSLSWVWETPVFWIFVVTWATDIFAYFAGRAIGGPKLAPRISPNKTWAGLIGGIAGAALLGWLLATWFEMEPFFLWMGGPMAAVAQAGDLYESWLKRRAGIKDSGSLLPGHGGVLDRLDGMLAVSFATMILLMAGFWTT